LLEKRIHANVSEGRNVKCAPLSEPAGRVGERENGRENFFIWNRRNPLKSPNSAKGIQGNPSFFVWISLDCLGIYLAAKKAASITYNISYLSKA
jgi:hypothetical protein